MGFTHRTELTDSFVARLKPQDKPLEITDALRLGLVLRVQPTGLKTYYLSLWSPDGAEKRYRYRWKIGEASTFRLFRNTPQKKSDRDRSIRDVVDELKAKARNVDLRQQKHDALKASERDQAATLGGFIDLHYAQFYADQGNARPEEMVRWLKNAFADLLPMRLDSITHLSIRNWQKQQDMADATVARLLQLLSGALSRAVVEGFIDSHPLQARERKRHGLSIPKPDNKRVRYLSDNEEKRLRAAMEARDKRLKAARARTIAHRKQRAQKAPAAISGAYADHLTPLLLLALKTGIRRGALLGLVWSDIKPNSIHVRASLDKARKGYHVPLQGEAAEVLRKWRHQTGGEGRVFTHRGKPIQSIRTAWANLLVEAQIDDFKFHDCRHNFASKLMMGGVNLYTVQKLLGHSSITTTERYAHLAPDHLKAAMKVLEQ